MFFYLIGLVAIILLVFVLHMVWAAVLFSVLAVVFLAYKIRTSVRNGNMGLRIFERANESLTWVECHKCDGMTVQVLLYNEKAGHNEWSIIPLHLRSVMGGEYARNNTNVANARTCPHCQGLGGYYVPEHQGPKPGETQGNWNRKFF